jgi:hypothetical protein
VLDVEYMNRRYSVQRVPKHDAATRSAFKKLGCRSKEL